MLTNVMSHIAGRWFYTFIMAFREGKLPCGWYFVQARGVTVKNCVMRRFV